MIEKVTFSSKAKVLSVFLTIDEKLEILDFLDKDTSPTGAMYCTYATVESLSKVYT